VCRCGDSNLHERSIRGIRDLWDKVEQRKVIVNVHSYLIFNLPFSFR